MTTQFPRFMPQHIFRHFQGGEVHHCHNRPHKNSRQGTMVKARMQRREATGHAQRLSAHCIRQPLASHVFFLSCCFSFSEQQLFDKNIFFAPSAKQWKHKVLGTFLEPKTPKIAVSIFGPTFPFWSVSGAKSAPKAENQHIFTFCVPKVKKRVFAILVEKVPETLRL